MSQYEAPAYMTTHTVAVSRKRCDRCNHLLYVDYGKRIEVVDDNDKTTAIITSKVHTGRCPSCFEYFEWHRGR
jgi:hypothetical protein